MTKGYPVLLNVEGRAITVIGGGKIAARKINGLLRAGAHVTVVSPELAATIAPESISWQKRNYKTSDLVGQELIFAATDDPHLNAAIAAQAKKGQWVNDVSNHEHSDFFNVAQVQNEDYLIGISTLGHSPMMAKALKQKLTEWLGKEE